MKQKMMGGTGMSCWTICKSFAPCSGH